MLFGRRRPAVLRQEACGRFRPGSGGARSGGPVSVTTVVIGDRTGGAELRLLSDSLSLSHLKMGFGGRGWFQRRGTPPLFTGHPAGMASLVSPGSAVPLAALR